LKGGKEKKEGCGKKPEEKICPHPTVSQQAPSPKKGLGGGKRHKKKGKVCGGFNPKTFFPSKKKNREVGGLGGVGGGVGGPKKKTNPTGRGGPNPTQKK